MNRDEFPWKKLGAVMLGALGVFAIISLLVNAFGGQNKRKTYRW
jgi:hypothetical protein